MSSNQQRAFVPERVAGIRPAVVAGDYPLRRLATELQTFGPVMDPGFVDDHRPRCQCDLGSTSRTCSAAWLRRKNNQFEIVSIYIIS
jgi:hypothetical protein